MEKYMLPCLSKKYLGMECFGCGLQRSVALFLRGEFVAAFEMYPALYPLILLGGVILLGQVVKLKYFRELVLVLGIVAGVFMVGNYALKHFF